MREKLAKMNLKRQAAKEKRARAAAQEAALAAEKEHERLAQLEEQRPLQMGSRLLGATGVTIGADVQDDGDEEDGDGGWITTDNFDVAQSQGIGRTGFDDDALNARNAAAQARVACVTTDFAMQNVMIQMQLRLITLDGRAVSTIRRFVLKCDACKGICHKLDKLFCPSCGNNTLARLSYSITPDGVLRYHYKKNRNVNTRGM
jgi:rRNA maturation endonuclease Nob1